MILRTIWDWLRHFYCFCWWCWSHFHSPGSWSYFLCLIHVDFFPEVHHNVCSPSLIFIFHVWHILWIRLCVCNCVSISVEQWFCLLNLLICFYQYVSILCLHLIINVIFINQLLVLHTDASSASHDFLESHHSLSFLWINFLAVGEDPAKSLTDTPPDFNQASSPSRAPPTTASLSNDNKFHSLPFSLSRKVGPNGSMSQGPLSLSAGSVMGEQQEVPPPATTPVQRPPSPAQGQPGLEVGSMVEVKENPPLCGVIRWVGLPPGLQEPLAGLELVSMFMWVKNVFASGFWNVLQIICFTVGV